MHLREGRKDGRTFVMCLSGYMAPWRRVSSCRRSMPLAPPYLFYLTYELIFSFLYDWLQLDRHPGRDPPR
jgi:hypothetical protein